MKYRLIRYETKPDRTAENRALIEGVFRELSAAAPQNAGYLVLELEDGTFMHLIANADDDNPIPKLAAFKAFQANQGERHATPAKAATVRIVGNYRMLAD